MGKERKVPCVRFFLIENGRNNFSQFGVLPFVFELQLLFQPQHCQRNRLAIALA